MDRCPKDESTAKNLVCIKSFSHSQEKLGKTCWGGIHPLPSPLVKRPPVIPKARGKVKETNEAEKHCADPYVSPTSDKMEDERPKCSCETSTKVIESKIGQLLDRFIQVEESIEKISALDGRVKCVESNVSSLQSEIQKLSGEIEDYHRRREMQELRWKP